jgi:YVTN family beta-propeller protein
MKCILTATISILLAFSPLGLIAQNHLLILNKSGNTAWQLDAETGEKISEFKTGVAPHEVAISPDRNRAIITNYGGNTPGNSLTIVDLQNQEVQKTISLGAYQRPHGVEWFADGKRAIVTTEAQQSAVIIDVDSAKIVSTIKTGQQVSHMVTLGTDELSAYITNLGSGSVSVLDLTTNKSTNVIKTGDGTEGVTTIPNKNEVWITNRSANTVSILDASTNKIIKTLKSSSFPIRAEVSSDGKFVAVSNAESSEVTIFDVASRQQIQKISTVEENQQGMPIGLTFSDDGNRLFVANSNINQIAVIDTNSWKVVKRFKTGATPDGIAYFSKSR